MSSPTVVPHNPEVEQALIGRLLAEPALTSEVVDTLLAPSDFFLAANRMLFAAIVEAFYADESIDPMVIGELHAKQLAKVWGTDERTAVAQVVRWAAAPVIGSPADHAKLVKRDSDYRALLKLVDEVRGRVLAEQGSPEEIAGVTTQLAMQIATHQALTNELVSFEDAGRAFVDSMRRAMAAREQGVELGAYFGLRAIDQFTKGLKPGELLMAGGEPGVGKSAVWWKAGLSFARRQAKRPEGQRIGTLIVSLEMSPGPSNARFASMLSGVPGDALREATLSNDQLGHIIRRWRDERGVPLWMNYAPTLRASQLRALVSEGIRRHNIGVVVLDHFRMFDLDQRLDNKLDEDEEKVRFLSEQIGQTLNVAVICLAHTRKPDPSSNGRPKMSDLRGSYQVAAHADFVSFIYRPTMYATQAQIDAGKVNDTDAEMIWAKNRHSDPGTSPFYFDARSMLITDQ
jgi:replicative DNA helicase